MTERVFVETIDDVANNEIRFIIKIPRNLKFLTVFDHELQKMISDAINTRDIISFVHGIYELVKRMETKDNG